MKKGKKHMGGTQRCRIEFGLAAGESERQIAKEIGVSLSTVSREIRKHTCVSFKGCYGRANQCVHRADCRLTGVCGDCPAKGAPCVRCSYRNCNRLCGQIKYIDCPQRLLRTAKVCNGCPDEKRCHRRKLFYVASTFADYRTFLAENPGAGPVFMDLVIGRPGGACLLTLHWLNASFMVGILIPNKCAANVVAAFDRLYEELGHELFRRLFPVILTDRGTEFSYPSRIERCEDGTVRTRVFFCDPMNSNQKSQTERNYGIVREILPKGASFDSLTQDYAYLALSHVNAYVRLSQPDRTPYDVFEFLYGEGTAAKRHIMKIDPREVVLKPRLVGIEVK